MAVADLPFDLAEVKLVAPLPRPGTVAKPDLLARLAGSSAPLVTVVAPAGYGKTTLLSTWAETDERPVAWVALDGRDDDVMVFLRYITAAIHTVAPLPRKVFDALSGPGVSSWAKHVPRLGAAWSALECPMVLVLDDLHCLGSSSCLDAVTALLTYVPDGSQVAIASREAPALPLAKWRAGGLEEEIGVPDLQLDEDQAARLLEAAGVELDAGEIAALTERTEGWPAGLYLAALSLQAGAPSAASVEHFSGGDRFVSEYFRHELLSRLPADEAQFLKHTSVLGRMSGALCDAVLETTDSGDALRSLAQANGFVIPLDRHGRWFRYHHLFAELLREELERTEPEAVPALNARAMDWCIANGRTEAAVLYGHAASETDTVAGLVDALALPLYYDGRLETLDGWLAWFDDDQLRRYPALAVVGAWLRALTGRPDEATRWLALAEGAESAIALSDGTETIEPWVATLRSSMMPDGVERAIADGDLALDGLAPESGWRPAAFALRGVAHALAGATDRATGDLMAAAKAGLTTGSTDVVFVAQAQLALIAADEGAWAEAGQRARAAQTLVEATDLADYSTSALVHVATARVALHEGRQEDGRAALTRAQRLRPLLDLGVPWLTIPVGLELTRGHLALTEVDAARTVLSETERMLERRPHMGNLVGLARELRERVSATSGSAGTWAMSLTAAELRLLPYLATHLTFPAIASRLFISRNTVKSEAVAIYRKLGAASRGEAIERAVEVGLLEGSIYPPRPHLVQDG